MITKVEIKNYRSIVDATVELSPFTLLIGANGVGKSNFLKLFEDLVILNPSPMNKRIQSLEQHFNQKGFLQEIQVDDSSLGLWKYKAGEGYELFPIQDTNQVRVFTLDPEKIGEPEQLIPNPVVNVDGSGAVQVLDSLKTGDREDLFDKIELEFKRFIPEIEKLSFIPATQSRRLQVREKHIDTPVPLATLSEGTRLILTILTIVFQENPPKFIGLEEINRGLHPRLFQQLIDFLQYISSEKGIQIVATTHNPYLVDQFKDREEAVIIVEKENGATTFTSLAQKLEDVPPEEEEPLGHLWYTGAVGGVPAYVR